MFGNEHRVTLARSLLKKNLSLIIIKQIKLRIELRKRVSEINFS